MANGKEGQVRRHGMVAVRCGMCWNTRLQLHVAPIHAAAGVPQPPSFLHHSSLSRAAHLPPNNDGAGRAPLAAWPRHQSALPRRRQP